MNRIKEFLEAKGMSQTDLAHQLEKVSIQSICMRPIRCNRLYLFCTELQKY